MGFQGVKILDFLGAKKASEYLSERKALHGKHAGNLKCAPACRRQIAVFVDAENVYLEGAKSALELCRNQGDIEFIYVYGPAGLIGSEPWLTLMGANGAVPVLCKGCVKGKNSVDINMVIGMMDALGTAAADTFAIVAGDSDYAPMIKRAQKAGKRVVGFSDKPTGQPFRDLFDEFHQLKELPKMPKKKKGKVKRSAASVCTSIVDDAVLVETINLGIDQLGDSEGWCQISQVSDYVRTHIPGFTPKRYGSKTFSKVISRLSAYEMKQAKNGVKVIRKLAA